MILAGWCHPEEFEPSTVHGGTTKETKIRIAAEPPHWWQFHLCILPGLPDFRQLILLAASHSAASQLPFKQYPSKQVASFFLRSNVHCTTTFSVSHSPNAMHFWTELGSKAQFSFSILLIWLQHGAFHPTNRRIMSIALGFTQNDVER